MNKAKFYLITFTIFLPFYLFSQTTKNGGISPEEKKRLENQFKALKTFYIDEDGVVVYTLPTNSNTPEQAKPSTVNGKKTVENKVDKPVKNTGVENEQRKADSSVDAKTTSVKIQTNVIDADKSDKTIEPIQIQTDSKTANLSGDVKVADKPKSEQKSVSAPKQDKSTLSADKPKSTPNVKPAEKVAASKTATPSSSAKQNVAATNSNSTQVSKNNTVFRKRQSSLKSLEEAAMAVDVLLDQLLEQQAQMNTPMNIGNNSISRRAVMPVDGSLRRTSGNTSGSEDDVLDDEFGGEPTYYINGVKVDKVEVNKLRPSDILKREIRVRNTVSGNPNGEWWIETRQ